MRTWLFSSMLVLLVSSFSFGNTELDNFFSDLPEDVIVRKIDCTTNGQIVEPWRLDSFHIEKDTNGIWNVILVVDGISVHQKVSAEYGKYTISYNSTGKRLDMTAFQGPDLALIFSNAKLELDQLYKVPQFSGPDLIRKCVYQ